MRRALAWLYERLISSDELATEASLCVKLLALCWLITGHALYVPRIFLPFWTVLDSMPAKELVWIALLLMGLQSVVGILFSYRMRACCIALAMVIFLSTLSSRIYFSNNRLFCACIFLLIGLTPNKEKPVLIRYQLVILYVGAALDKLLHPDWRSGQFMESFSRRLGEFGSLWSPNWKVGEPNVYLDLYLWIADLLPPMMLSRFVSWMTILTELSLAILFFGGWIRPAIVLGLLFHSGLLLLTGSTMGMFFYAVLCAYVACSDAESEAKPWLPATDRWLLFVIAIVLAGPWFRSWMVFVLLVYLYFAQRSTAIKAQTES
jgi:hypothetical protein